MARRAALAEVQMSLHNWKIDQLTIRQQQLEEDLNRTVLERNVELFHTTAGVLGLTIGNPATIPPSRPTPTMGNKRTVSGSAPQPERAAHAPSLPSIPDVPLPQAPPLDVVTLTAAIQTAMQPFMARLAAIETSTVKKNATNTATPASRLNLVQADKEARPLADQTMPDRPHPTAQEPQPDEEWVQVTNRAKRGKRGKPDQANPTLQQINLTPWSYAMAAATTQPSGQGPTPNQPSQPANPPPPAFMEVTVVRFGGSLNTQHEQATRVRQPDAIVREVRANMSRAVAKPLPIVAGRWSSGSQSKGNFVFTM
jgi:hypothetical protein